jgi:nucleoside-diphosphate-sugar epimerase
VDVNVFSYFKIHITIKMKGKSGMIIGGAGQLGKHVVSRFKNKGWRILNVDLRTNTEADANLVLTTDKMQN